MRGSFSPPGKKSGGTSLSPAATKMGDTCIDRNSDLCLSRYNKCLLKVCNVTVTVTDVSIPWVPFPLSQSTQLKAKEGFQGSEDTWHKATQWHITKLTQHRLKAEQPCLSHHPLSRQQASLLAPIH